VVWFLAVRITVEGVHPIAQEANEILIAVCVLRGRSEFEIIYKLKHILIHCVEFSVQ
jgi:hypothetical protein